MAEILHGINVKAPSGRTWGIETYITRETAEFWREQGLEVTEILNTIPEWWVDAGLPVRWWCFWQDVFHFKNPWSKS